MVRRRPSQCGADAKIEGGRDHQKRANRGSMASACRSAASTRRARSVTSIRTDINPFDIAKAKKLLAEAGVTTPLEVSLKLPPPPYARQGGEVLAAQLARSASLPRSTTLNGRNGYRQCSTATGPHNYDLTIVSHVSRLIS